MEGNIRVHKLDNGLTVLGFPDSSALSAAIGVFVASGARDEKVSSGGISHFIEHMLFKGTTKRNALELTHAISDLGAQSNAFTSEEETVYYAALLPSRMLQMEGILFEMLHPSFPEDELTLERQVILEEIAGYRDRPQFFLFEKAFRDYFGGHPCGNSILGNEESVAAISRKDLVDFFTARYSPSNIVVGAAGNFDWESFLAHTCETGAALNGPGTVRAHSSHTHTPGYTEYYRANLHQTHAAMFLPGPSVKDDERYPCAVVSTILGDVTGSRLYFELVESGLAETATMETDERDDTGCLTVYTVTKPDCAAEVSAMVRKCLNTAVEFTEGDLERAKRKLCARMVQSSEAPLGRLIGMGSDYLALSRAVSLRENLARIQAVTRTDIKAALDRFPVDEPAEFRLVPDNG